MFRGGKGIFFYSTSLTNIIQHYKTHKTCIINRSYSTDPYFNKIINYSKCVSIKTKRDYLIYKRDI